MDQVKLRAPKGASSASFGGEEFKVEKGWVTVPTEAVAALVEHGFRTLGDEPEHEKQEGA